MSLREVNRGVQFLRELIVIVLGVLIALAVDAAWSYRQERMQEREHIEALIGDFEEDRARLSEVAARFDTIAAAAEALTSLGPRREGAPSADSLGRLLRNAVRGDRFEPRSAARTDLEVSGGLRVLRDARLRRELSTYTSELDRIRNRTETFLEQTNTGLLQLEIEFADIFGSDRSEAFPAVEFDRDAVFDSRRVRNEFAWRADFASRNARDHRRTLETANRILDLLREQQR
jgi:hypothetical protein